jgi:GNAT superfamily N-acetyltransferase
MGSRMRYRGEVFLEDCSHVQGICESSGFFYPEEVEIAVELVQERLKSGTESGYFFLFAEYEPGVILGYTCYGPIACTQGSFDLYWIVVGKAYQNQGIGRGLLAETEKVVSALGGRKIYIETSSRKLYLPTQGFYTHCGYSKEAILADFYAPGDSKIIYVKDLST